MKQKWIPQVGETYYSAQCIDMQFIPMMFVAVGVEKEYTKTWLFQTREECQDYCNRLNLAISNIKP